MTFIEAEIYHLIVHHPNMDDSCLASQERVKQFAKDLYEEGSVKIW